MSAGTKRRVRSPPSPTLAEPQDQHHKRTRLREPVSTSTMSTTKALFMTFRTELDAHHDFNEKLVRFSRDVTAESKKLIFLLHRFNPLFSADHPTNQKLLQEAQVKAESLRAHILQTAAMNRLGPSPAHPINAEEMERIAAEATATASGTGKDDENTKNKGETRVGKKAAPSAENSRLVLPPMSKAGMYSDRYERTFGPGLEEYVS